MIRCREGGSNSRAGRVSAMVVTAAYRERETCDLYRTTLFGHWKWRIAGRRGFVGEAGWWKEEG